MKIKESTIEIFNFVVFKSMKGTKITELATLRPLRRLRLKSYSSFNFCHLWLHFTYCTNMRSYYSRYIWSSLVTANNLCGKFTLAWSLLFLVTRKLQGFESPSLVLLPLKDTHRLVIRKKYVHGHCEANWVISN